MPYSPPFPSSFLLFVISLRRTPTVALPTHQPTNQQGGRTEERRNDTTLFFTHKKKLAHANEGLVTAAGGEAGTGTSPPADPTTPFNVTHPARRRYHGGRSAIVGREKDAWRLNLRTTFPCYLLTGGDDAGTFSSSTSTSTFSPSPALQLTAAEREEGQQVLQLWRRDGDRSVAPLLRHHERLSGFPGAVAALFAASHVARPSMWHVARSRELLQRTMRMAPKLSGEAVLRPPLTYALRVAARAGSIPDAHELLGAMTSLAVLPNAETLKEIVELYARHGRVCEAKEVLACMHGTPEYPTRDDDIRAAVHVATTMPGMPYADVSALYSKLEAAGIALTPASWRRLVAACAGAAETGPADVHRLLGRMAAKRVAPAEVHYAHLLSSAARTLGRASAQERARRLLAQYRRRVSGEETEWEREELAGHRRRVSPGAAEGAAAKDEAWPLPDALTPLHVACLEQAMQSAGWA